MAACAAYLMEDPAALRGEWLGAFPEQHRLCVELGCGKGRFTVESAAREPEVLFVGIEKVPDAMILAMARARDRALTNVRFLDFDAANLGEIFAPGEIDRIYLNFSDPWPKSRDAKFRLTAPNFLRLYAELLSPGGEIHFKTDNAALFVWSLAQFRAEGWALSEQTDDLHRDGPVGVLTDYEAKFMAEGLPIHRVVAARTAETLTTAAGAVPRLRNAALADARGAALPEGLRLGDYSLARCQAFYRDFVQSPELFEDPGRVEPYVYAPERVEAYYRARMDRKDRRYCSILLGDAVIGELVFKNIDPAERRCDLGICLVNDRFKNRGYGTAAERLALELAFGELGMETVLADSLLANTRSQHVLEKLGFRQVSEDGHFRYYAITRAQYRGDGEVE